MVWFCREASTPLTTVLSTDLLLGRVFNFSFSSLRMWCVCMFRCVCPCTFVLVCTEVRGWCVFFVLHLPMTPRAHQVSQSRHPARQGSPVSVSLCWDYKWSSLLESWGSELWSSHIHHSLNLPQPQPGWVFFRSRKQRHSQQRWAREAHF